MEMVLQKADAPHYVAPIDFEQLNPMPAKTLLQLVELYQSAKRHTQQFQVTINALPQLFLKLEQLDIDVAFDIRYGSIDIAFTGDGARLAEVWAALRQSGYKPSSRPEKGATAFSAFWNREEFAKIWMNFSSSVCRRVQIGTQMVETPIYETQCGDLPELPEDKVTAVVAGEADDLPF